MAVSQTTSSLELRLSDFEKLNKLVEMVYSIKRRRQFSSHVKCTVRDEFRQDLCHCYLQ